MEIKYDIDDKKISNFTEEAKSKLIQHSRQHTLEIISEAEKVEASLREDGAESEITGNMIFQAARKLRSSPAKKSKFGRIIIKILSEFFLLFSGFLFSIEQFAANINQMYWFLAVFIIAVILTAITYVKEGD